MRALLRTILLGGALALYVAYCAGLVGAIGGLACAVLGGLVGGALGGAEGGALGGAACGAVWGLFVGWLFGWVLWRDLSRLEKWFTGISAAVGGVATASFVGIFFGGRIGSVSARMIQRGG